MKRMCGFSSNDKAGDGGGADVTDRYDDHNSMALLN
jgi:hypothetical protein